MHVSGVSNRVPEFLGALNMLLRNVDAAKLNNRTRLVEKEPISHVIMSTVFSDSAKV